MSVMMANRHNVSFPHGKEVDQHTEHDGLAQDSSGTYLSAPSANMLYDQTQTSGMMYQPSGNSGHSMQHLAPQTWSPASTSEHISPHAFSDGYSDITQHSSPGNLEQFPELQYLPLADPSDISSADFNFSPQMSVSQMPVSAGEVTMPFMNPQMAPIGPSASPQHLSPDITGHMNMGQGASSPFYQQSSHVSRPENNDLSAVALGPSMMPSLDVSLNTNDYALTTHIPSPIVRVENYSRSDSPHAGPMSPSQSKRGGGSRKSSVHLSPYPDAIDDDDDDDEEDGRSHRLGVAPQTRDQIKDQTIPSLEDMDQLEKDAERNANVQHWLTITELDSLIEDRGRAGKGPQRPRARSTNDVKAQQGVASNASLVLTIPEYSGLRVPGPGLYIDEKSEAEDDEPDSPAADLNIGARDADETYIPPIDTKTEDANTPLVVKSRPWEDSPFETEDPQPHYQPLTSNAAMMRFDKRAKDIESASLAATVGSRRNMSETDLVSLLSATGISTQQAIEDKEKLNDNRSRRPSVLNHITRRFTSNNTLKRKTVQTSPQPKSPVPPPADAPAAKQTEPTLGPPKRIGSWSRPKSPRPDGPPSRTNSDLKPTPPTLILPQSSSGPFAQVKNALKRSRSRSEIKGLAQLMTGLGGPPVVSINSPTPDITDRPALPVVQPNRIQGQTGGAGGDATIFMDLAVRTDLIIPTPNGFKDQVRQLNPRIPEYLLERLTQEQHKRFKRLSQMKIDHMKVVRNGKCSSNTFCFALGGDAKIHPPAKGEKDNTRTKYQVMQPGMTEDDLETNDDGSVVQAATFPSGIPAPPVKSLPAEFECPLCFKVKKFNKPSDWTKHVREDTQPFTCTFPNCSEPRSFSRKADWVRHESERHRQLESWTCNISGCVHTCYRRDNFVQHLDREHKLPVSRVRPGRGQGSKSPNTPLDSMPQSWDPSMLGDSDMMPDVSMIIEQCHHKTVKDPKQEPCKFCGNILSDWKKLEVHLSKHMEQISLPVLRLVEQRKVDADTKLSPVEGPQKLYLTPSPSSFMGNASPYFDEPSVFEGSPISSKLAVSTTFPQYNTGMASLSVPSSAANTYPPPQMAPRKLSSSQLNSPMYGYPTTPDTNVAFQQHVSPVTPTNMHDPSASLQGSFSASDNGNGRFVQGMGHTYPPMLTIPNTDFNQQAYHDSSSAISPYAQSEMAPTYIQHGSFTGSPTGSLYDQAGVQRSSPGQNDPFAAYAPQSYYQNS